MFRRILVAIDESEQAAAAGALAMKMAAEHAGSELIFVHAVDVAADFAEAAGAQMLAGGQELADQDRADAQRLVDAAARTARAQGIDAAGVVVDGNPATAIAEYADAHHVDVIVTGTHGRRGLSHLFLGSTAEGILLSARVPVLTVRQGPPARGSGEPEAHSQRRYSAAQTERMG